VPIKRKERLLNEEISAAGTAYSSWVNTENLKDFTFVLRAETTSGSSSDYVDAWIETSDTNSTTQTAGRRRALDLVDPIDNTIQQKFDRVEGGVTLPTDTKTETTLRQQLDYKSPNVDEYVRLAYTAAGTPSNLGTIIIDMYANKET